MLKVLKVEKNSIASSLGIEVGDEILAFDCYPCEDELDYLYYEGVSSFSITLNQRIGLRAPAQNLSGNGKT